jgi:hypothetical protein
MHAKVVVALLAGAAVWSLTGAAAQDDEGDADDEPVRCLSMGTIRSTRVVDDRTVLFFHGRARIYLNRLERECVGLARNGTFTYQVQSGARAARLCDTDSITVLERAGRGFNCGLGMFEPISQEEADSFLLGPNRAVTSTPVEPPKAEEAALPAAESQPAPLPE